jgi:hypothetical protein
MQCSFHVNGGQAKRFANRHDEIFSGIELVVQFHHALYAFLHTHSRALIAARKQHNKFVAPDARRTILIRPCEVSSRIANATILEVANNALRVLLQHRHMIVRDLA